jgi:intracellular multiplication protein IcmJ
MSLLQMSLGVKRNIDAQGSSSGSKRKPLTRQQISKLLQHTLEKDNFACCYCGFTSRQYQKAIPKDWSVNDPRDAELVTACIFCEQCFALETVAPMASGYLVWMPDMPQATLNNIVRAIYVARSHGSKLPERVAACADRAMDIFTHARGEAKRRIGTDDPAVLATVLLENLDARTYGKRSEKLEGVRLMPADKRVVVNSKGVENDQFPKILSFWTSPEGPFGTTSPDKWESLLKVAAKSA